MSNQINTKILICGGAGYVGGYLSDLLVNHVYDVTIYDNLTYEPRYMKNIHFINGDIRDTDKLGTIINDYDAVIWLAAIVGDGACAVNPGHTREVNVESVRWLTQNYNGKVIFMSTCSVYGINNDMLHEASVTNPLSLYAETKLEAEKIITNTVPDHLVFRLGTLFGVSDYFSRLRLDLVVNRLTMKATRGEPLTVFGGGQWRPLLHVKDVAEAILFGIENNVTGIYNLSHQNYRISEIATEIKGLIPKVSVSYHNLKFEDLRNYRVSAEKFRRLGWYPKFNLAYGIQEIHQAIKDHRIKQPDDELYSNAEFLKDKLM